MWLTKVVPCVGHYPCSVQPNATHALYGESIYERHRHRYEFNNDYKAEFESNGLVFSAFAQTITWLRSLKTQIIPSLWHASIILNLSLVH